MSMYLDGFIAGPKETVENGLGDLWKLRMRLLRQPLDPLEENLQFRLTRRADDSAVKPDLAVIVRQAAGSQRLVHLVGEPADERVRDEAVVNLENAATSSWPETCLPPDGDCGSMAIAPRIGHGVSSSYPRTHSGGFQLSIDQGALRLELKRVFQMLPLASTTSLKVIGAGWGCPVWGGSGNLLDHPSPRLPPAVHGGSHVLSRYAAIDQELAAIMLCPG